MVGTLVANQKRANRLLMNLNWTVFSVLLLLLSFNEAINELAVSYYYAAISLEAVLAILLYGEFCYFKYYKKDINGEGLKKYILFSMVILSVTTVYITGNVYVLGFMLYPIIATILYYDGRLVTYISIVQFLITIIVLENGMINFKGTINIFSFMMYIAIELGLTLIILVRYADTSKAIIYSVSEQKEKLRENIEKLQEANHKLTVEHGKMMEVNKPLMKTKEELKRAYEDLKKTQTQLIYNDKMVSLGHLAAGLAHEFNTPIGVLNCNVDVSDRLVSMLAATFEHENDKKARDILAKIADVNKVNIMACSRILNIVKSLNNFSRIDEAEYKKVDIHEGLNSTLILLNNRLKSKVTLKKEYGSIPKIKCYPNLLNQVFMNLLTNAADAIIEQGTIIIKTYVQEGKVCVSIKDDGVGIPKEIIKKIFEQGYTTKEVGAGTGLGLTIVQGIVKKHDGGLRVISEPGKGAEFIVELPIVE